MTGAPRTYLSPGRPTENLDHSRTPVNAFLPPHEFPADNVFVKDATQLAGVSLLAALPPEYRLLLACVSAPIQPKHETIDALLHGPLDWQRLLETARAQRVAALCYPVIEKFARASMPGDLMEAFRAEATTTAARNLRMAARLLEIDERAAHAGIPLVSYKGPVLAEMAYGNLGAREFIDLDFILPHRHLRTAWDLLERLGYCAASPALAASDAPVPGEYIFLSPKNDVGIEVHTEYTMRHFPVPPDLDPLIAAREPIPVTGRRVLTFSREDTLTLLAVHGAKDFWGQLLWICDIARLVEHPGFDWQKALGQTERMGCRRMTNLALLLASETLGASVPGNVLELARADGGVQSDARWLMRRLFTTGPIGRWEQLRHRVRMVQGFWPGVRYAARLATTPAADDWNALRLPAPLGFAYALLRPLRLFRR